MSESVANDAPGDRSSPSVVPDFVLGGAGNTLCPPRSNARSSRLAMLTPFDSLCSLRSAVPLLRLPRLTSDEHPLQAYHSNWVQMQYVIVPLPGPRFDRDRIQNTDSEEETEWKKQSRQKEEFKRGIRRSTGGVRLKFPRTAEERKIRKSIISDALLAMVQGRPRNVADAFTHTDTHKLDVRKHIHSQHIFWSFEYGCLCLHNLRTPLKRNVSILHVSFQIMPT